MDNSFLYLDSGVSKRISRLFTLVDKGTLFFLRPACIFFDKLFKASPREIMAGQKDENGVFIE